MSSSNSSSNSRPTASTKAARAVVAAAAGLVLLVALSAVWLSGCTATPQMVEFQILTDDKGNQWLAEIGAYKKASQNGTELQVYGVGSTNAKPEILAGNALPAETITVERSKVLVPLDKSYYGQSSPSSEPVPVKIRPLGIAYLSDLIKGQDANNLIKGWNPAQPINLTGASNIRISINVESPLLVGNDTFRVVAPTFNAGNDAIWADTFELIPNSDGKVDIENIGTEPLQLPFSSNSTTISADWKAKVVLDIQKLLDEGNHEKVLSCIANLRKYLENLTDSVGLQDSLDKYVASVNEVKAAAATAEAATAAAEEAARLTAEQAQSSDPIARARDFMWSEGYDTSTVTFTLNGEERYHGLDCYIVKASWPGWVPDPGYPGHYTGGGGFSYAVPKDTNYSVQNVMEWAAGGSPPAR